MCPHYMSIGMTYDEFWNGDVSLVRAYRKADEIKRRRQNELMWMQGIYFRDALACTVVNMLSGKGAKKFEYSGEPYPITSEQVAEREKQKRKNMEERLKAEFAAFATTISRHNKENGK